MEETSEEKALEIAVQYLADQIHGQLSFIDNPPVGVYGNEEITDCWCILVSDTHIQHIGAGRVICISKHTGDIIFDGFVGE